MSHEKHNSQWMIDHVHNTARFFTENPHISWMVLVFTALWGIYGFLKMPQRKDPDLPVKVAMAICPWPGVESEKVEELITRRIEEKMAENVTVKKIESTTRVGVSFVWVELQESVSEPGKEFDDIKLRLDDMRDLPEGAGPIQFVKDFGSTAALMLTVASPRVNDVQVELRAKTIERAIAKVRGNDDARVSIVYGFPASVAHDGVRRSFGAFVQQAVQDGVIRDTRLFEGSGFVGVDAVSGKDDAAILKYGYNYLKSHLRVSEIHPDAWQPAIIRHIGETSKKIAEVMADKYSYRDLNDYADLIKRTFQTIPQVSKIDIAGNLEERVYLSYSQERLASYGIPVNQIGKILSARNTPISGGMIEVNGRNITIDPSGEFTSEKEIGDVIIAQPKNGPPVYLRDVAEINRSYESPARYLNFYTWKDTNGNWQRTRAVTLAIQMRPGEKIGDFGKAVDATLANLKTALPEDLIYARTSDQPLQVEENVDLFMNSLYEAIILVVIIALVGFWEWRSAFLLSLSIPLTLAMTFGMIWLLGIDIQQVSIASLIIALGLLVDDPVVAGDSIKRGLAEGLKPIHAAWIGPTKLATAILYATITNIVAYLPFLMLSGDQGLFLYSLPVVLTCSLIASRIVSMAFIPLLGYYILRPDRKPEKPMSEKRTQGFTGWYYRTGTWAIQHRWKVMLGAVVMLVVGFGIGSRLKTQYFPKDLSYLSYIDIWLPEDASLYATRGIASEAEAIVREVAAEYGNKHENSDVLESLTTFVGGGGPRFWFSLSPEPRQQNYATIIIQVKDKHDTQHLLEELQTELTKRIAGARINARQLETGPPVGVPISIRIAGDDATTLKKLSQKVQAILRSIPTAERVHDDWGAENFAVNLDIDADRANLSGITNLDIAASTSTGMNGYQISVLREGDKQIPILARLRMDERAQLSDINNLYVYSMQTAQKIQLKQISNSSLTMKQETIKRRNQFRTITASAFPTAGYLPSEVLALALPKIKELERTLPPGYKLTIAGEAEKQAEGFGQVGVVMLVSIIMIFMALVIQFKNAVKPLLVFAAIPFGAAGALVVLWIMDAPFGFMAFLGVASLIGVIVSHVIVLFDFIEEKHVEGAPLMEALLDAGIVRLRPVLITVGATVFALFPLASHGGPLWEPLCYAQIGGLTIATFVTLILVPVLYSIFVLDFKIVKWERNTINNE